MILLRIQILASLGEIEHVCYSEDLRLFLVSKVVFLGKLVERGHALFYNLMLEAKNSLFAWLMVCARQRCGRRRCAHLRSPIFGEGRGGDKIIFGKTLKAPPAPAGRKRVSAGIT